MCRPGVEDEFKEEEGVSAQYHHTRLPNQILPPFLIVGMAITCLLVVVETKCLEHLVIKVQILEWYCAPGHDYLTVTFINGYSLNEI